MAPSNPLSSAQAANAKLEQPEEILQAVVVADSFDQHFMPLTLDLPRCLIPLCNVPLIDYTLEFLAVADVKEVFIVCVSHYQMIREYILNSHWSKGTSPMKIYVIVCKDSTSVGDVLRELDNKALIKSDFVLVHGDVVSNLDLDPVLRRHRQRRKEDPDCLMTMVLKQGHVMHRAQGWSSVFLMDPSDQRCLHYLHDVHPVVLPPEVFEHASIELRHDLIDCGIDVCAPEVLALFSENFDYQDLRKHFVRGLLESDLFTKHIYICLIDKDYALRVKSTHAYDCVAQDMMCRWVYPIVPEANIHASSKNTYQYSRGNLYREHPVFLEQTASLTKNVVLGHHCHVGEGTAIRNCVLGSGCRVGSHSTLEQMYAWDGCRIGSHCSVTFSILATEVELGDRVVVGKGCILGKGVKVDAGSVLPPHTKLMRPRNGMCSDASLVGPQGVGCRWQPHLLDDEYSGDDFEEPSFEEQDRIQSSGEPAGWVHDIGSDPVASLEQYFTQLSLSLVGGGDSFSQETILSTPPSLVYPPHRTSFASPSASSLAPQTSSRSSLTSASSTSSTHLSKGQHTTSSPEWETNSTEIQLTLLRALEQGHTLENTLLELNTLKFACNLSFEDLRQEVVPCLLTYIFERGLPTTPLNIQLETWLPVLQKLMHRRVKDQWHVLQLMTDFFRLCPPQWAKKFSTVAMHCYDMDLIEEDVFLKFYETLEQQQERQQQQQQQGKDPMEEDIALKSLKPFMDWLANADEEEVEDEDGEVEVEESDEDEDEDEEEEEEDEEDSESEAEDVYEVSKEEWSRG